MTPTLAIQHANKLPAATRETTAVWKDLRVSFPSLCGLDQGRIMPGNRHIEIVWIHQGSAVVEERELGGEWLRTHVRPGDLFLTAPGAAYEVRVAVDESKPYEIMVLTLAQSLFVRAVADVFGDQAGSVYLRDVSGFQDEFINALLIRLRGEFLLGRKASRLFVQAAGESLAVHLARYYTVTSAHSSAPPRLGGLPAFKLRRVTDRMLANLEDGFCLADCAREADMSEFHFSRMFKRATGKSPSQYFIWLKMEKAQNLLRKTNKDVIEIALDLGYASPSHFAQVFRRETGQSPVEYRRLT